jgi:RimJ/RimL family protein N-acetyltransferase
MFIRSERLFLRPGWPEDWAELFDLIDDEAVVRHLARAPWPYRAEDARAFAARVQDGHHPISS